MASNELLQVVDGTDRPLCAAKEARIYRKGLLHRVARIMLNDGEGNWLLTTRSAHKATYPGRWDSSAAGRVNLGESYVNAAAREAFEEIGLRALQLTPMCHYFSQNRWQGLIANEWQTNFVGTIAQNTPLTLQPEEVASAQWLPERDIIDLARTNPEQCTHGLREIARRLQVA